MFLICYLLFPKPEILWTSNHSLCIKPRTLLNLCRIDPRRQNVKYDCILLIEISSWSAGGRTVIRLSPAGIDGRIKTPFLLTFKTLCLYHCRVFNYSFKTSIFAVARFYAEVVLVLMGCSNVFDTTRRSTVRKSTAEYKTINNKYSLQ